MTRLQRVALAVMVLAVVAGCAQSRPPAGAAAQRGGTVRMVAVDSIARLEVIDWGGTGPPIVFLAGLGNSAHVFDDFAPRFTDRFHVIGITRRGFGASVDAPPTGSLDTLVDDIRVVLDSLRLGAVAVVGHSIAGEEMTFFGAKYPDRCTALIYIDAAYDRTSDVAHAQPDGPPQPPLGPKDAASVASISRYATRVSGVTEPESEIRATLRFDAAGRFVDEVAGSVRKLLVVKAERAPRYDLVHCRSLALYAIPDSPRDLVAYHDELDSAGRAAS